MIRAKVKFGIKISTLVLTCSGLILAICYIKPGQTGTKAAKNNITSMNWIKLEDEQELEKIKALSASESILIFKHSTRCSISSTAINRLERSWKDEEMKDTKIYYLDLITYRNISNKIEEDFNIRHESPQLLLIKNGKCEYNASHLAINYDEIAKATKK